MIYYALNHREGAKTLAKKYSLRPAPPEDYIKEGALKAFVTFPDHDKLMYAMQENLELYAYTLSGLQLYFHPDSMLPIVIRAHRDHFASLV